MCVCVRGQAVTGTRERIREFTSEPAHFGTAKRRRIERLSYRGIRGGEVAGPSPTFPRRSSYPPALPCIPRKPSLSHSDGSLVHPSSPPSPSLSRSLSAFVPRPFSLPFRPRIAPSSPSVSLPLIPNVRTPAYMSLLLTTTLYYRHPRTTTCSGVSTTFRPDLRPASNREISSGEFSGGRGERRRALRDDAIYARYFLPRFLAKLPLQCAPHLEWRVVTYLFYLLAAPISPFPLVEFYLTAGFSSSN